MLGSLVAFKATEGKKSSSISLLLVPRARAHRRRHAQGREKGRRRLWRRQEERRRKQKGEQFVNVAGVIVVVGVGIFIDSSRRRPDFVVVWPFCLRYGRGSGPAWPHQPREHLLLQLGAPGKESRKKHLKWRRRRRTIVRSGRWPSIAFSHGLDER